MNLFYVQNPDLEPYPPGYNKQARPARAARNGNQDENIDFNGFGTFDMAKTLAEYRCYTVVTQYYSVENWREFANMNTASMKYVLIACTSDEGEYEHLYDVLTATPDLKMISIPYNSNISKHDYVMFLRRVKMAFPNHTVMAGNILEGPVQKKIEKKNYSHGAKEAGPIIVNLPAAKMEIPVARNEDISMEGMSIFDPELCFGRDPWNSSY